MKYKIKNEYKNEYFAYSQESNRIIGHATKKDDAESIIFSEMLEINGVYSDNPLIPYLNERQVVGFYAYAIGFRIKKGEFLSSTIDLNNICDENNLKKYFNKLGE